MELRIRDLSKTYPGGVRALTNVTLTIPMGIYGLLGPSGAGKSTLIRILSTLQEPDTGTVHLDDLDVVRQKDEVRKTLGYLPQEFGVGPDVNADDLVEHSALLKAVGERRAPRDVVDALLRLADLWRVRRHEPDGCPRATRQRFGVSVSLLGNPRLMILDEPTAGLDAAERIECLNLLSELGKHSVVLVATHLVDDVSELCARIAIMHEGRVLLEIEPRRAVEELRGRIWRGEISTTELSELRREHHVISTKLLSGRTLASVVSDAVPGPGFKSAEPNLEDVYASTLARIDRERRNDLAALGFAYPAGPTFDRRGRPA